jgi:hypothetical protein
MLAIHDPLTRPRCDRLQTTGLALGLVRLLQDAGRTDEATAILSLLGDGFQGAAEERDEPQPLSSYAALALRLIPPAAQQVPAQKQVLLLRGEDL